MERDCFNTGAQFLAKRLRFRFTQSPATANFRFKSAPAGRIFEAAEGLQTVRCRWPGPLPSFSKRWPQPAAGRSGAGQLAPRTSLSAVHFVVVVVVVAAAAVAVSAASLAVAATSSAHPLGHQRHPIRRLDPSGHFASVTTRPVVVAGRGRRPDARRVIIKRMSPLLCRPPAVGRRLAAGWAARRASCLLPGPYQQVAPVGHAINPLSGQRIPHLIGPN